MTAHSPDRQPFSRSFLLTLCFLSLFASGTQAAPKDTGAHSETRVVKANGRTYRCKVVTVDPRRLEARLIIASDGLGRTEAFDSMLRRSRAVVGVNGSFFDAYNPVGDKDPNMTLIRSGQVVHKGGAGTLVGFGPRGSVVMGRVDLPIRGTVAVAGRPLGAWYAYWINRTPQSADNITIFTPARGSRARVTDGICVVVNNNVVQRVAYGDAQIPPTGYVIHFRGGEVGQAQKFPIGAEVGYRVQYAGPNAAAWQSVNEAFGAGPRLITDGAITFAPLEEGFQDPKILTNYGLRNALGVLRDGRIILVSLGGVTVQQLASIMKALGAYQAMNLDGGASASLYCNGQTLVRPGRLLSNALVFVRP